jgi:ornithine carbamoyltransferase
VINYTAVARHLLTLLDLSEADFESLTNRAVDLANEPECGQLLKGRYIGIYFRKTSTRTRTSFSVAAMRMGAGIVTYGAGDLQICTGESIEDTARVLSGYLDALVLRTAGDPGELRRMASSGTMAIVNAMSSDEHPTQAISDFAMIKRRFGTWDGLRMLYLGEGNNTAVALAFAASLCRNFHAVFLTPEGYGIPKANLEMAQRRAHERGSSVVQSHHIQDDIGLADIVYTTRWETTGTAKSDELWRKRFAPFRVTEALMQRAATKRTVFMHDLPAVRGEDCDSGVLDGAISIAFEQARQKLFSAMAVLQWCIE